MWPLSLVFSSDEQTSNSLIQALKDLEFEVESCPEIFSAVEKITSRTFDVIVSDWNEGLEAAFLLKTSRELRANHAAFIVAIADAEAITAAREAGADLILSRPIISNDVKYALLTCDQFLATEARCSANSRRETRQARTQSTLGIRRSPANVVSSSARVGFPACFESY